MIPLNYYLIITFSLFFIGLTGVMLRRNLLMILISLELMFNSVALTFTIFNRYLYPNQADGIVYTLFTIGIATAELTIGLGIVIALYRQKQDLSINDLNTLKH